MTSEAERRFWRQQIAVENGLTPLDIAALCDRAGELTAPRRIWLNKLLALAPFDAGRPQAYARLAIHPDIDLFRDPRVETAHKRLIIAFCGGSDRLYMPIPAVLQYLPSRLFDVAVLRDRERRHYADGISGYAPDLVQLIRRLASELATTSYEGVICYGTSMGGFPAIRAAVTLSADRAVSVGGRFAWSIRRLIEAPERPFQAFDPLCTCVRSVRTQAIAVYSEDNREDDRDANALAAAFPVAVRPIAGTSNHNVVLTLYTRGELASFYGSIFDFDPAAES